MNLTTEHYTLEEPNKNVRHYLEYQGCFYSMTLKEATDAAHRWRLRLPFMMHIKKCRTINKMPRNKPKLILYELQTGDRTYTDTIIRWRICI